ncbi:hypothetical protein ACJX0J_022487, partial [Zea mays]
MSIPRNLLGDTGWKSLDQGINSTAPVHLHTQESSSDQGINSTAPVHLHTQESSRIMPHTLDLFSKGRLHIMTYSLQIQLALQEATANNLNLFAVKPTNHMYTFTETSNLILFSPLGMYFVGDAKQFGFQNYLLIEFVLRAS